jgi:hypothetical protein
MPLTAEGTVIGLCAALAVALGSGANAAAAAPTKLECSDANDASISLKAAGKLIEARSALAVCTATSCPAPIRDDCTRRGAELNAKIPTILFHVVDGDERDLPGVTVSLDGAPPTPLSTTDTELDPGSHVFAFYAPGQPVVTKTFVVNEGERSRAERVVLGAGATSDEPRGGGRSRQRIAGLVIGGVGVASLVVGAALGGVAIATWHRAESDCGTGCSPTSRANAERSSAIHDATGSSVAFAVGGAMAATGVIIVLTAPSKAAPSRPVASLAPDVGRGGGGLSLVCGW